jgi:nicotinamidase-related amidase
MNALLLMDLQLDFLARDGRMPVGEGKAAQVISVANHMAEAFEERNWPVIVICNQFKKNDYIGNFFRKHAALEGSEGGKIDPRVLVHDAQCFSKAQSSAFTNSDFCAYLKTAGIGQVSICGVYAEGCVRATAFDALRAGMETVVIGDGVASKRWGTCKWALSHMGKRGIRIMESREYLDSPLRMPRETIR